MIVLSWPVAEDQEVEGKYGQVDGDWPNDEAEGPGKEVVN